jgi:hypothetical protein
MTKAQAEERLSTLYLQEKNLFERVQAARKVWVSFSNLGHALKQHEIQAQNVAAQDLNRVSWEYAYVKMEIDSLTTLLS